MAFSSIPSPALCGPQWETSVKPGRWNLRQSPGLWNPVWVWLTFICGLFWSLVDMGPGPQQPSSWSRKSLSSSAKSLSAPLTVRSNLTDQFLIHGHSWRLYFLLLLVSHSVLSNSLQLHGLQHTRLPCPSLSPRVCSNSCPLGQWCHPTISSSVIPFFSCPPSFPASGSFPVSPLFASRGHSIRASASILPMNIWGWFPLGLTDLTSLLSKGLSRLFSSLLPDWTLNDLPTSL